MIRLLWALSAHARYYLRRYMPTNIALDAIRTRRGLKWGILAMLLAVPYFLAANYCITLIEGGGPGWLNLLVLLFCWNALKFLIMGLVSVILLVRARVQEAVERRRPPHERGTVPQVPDGECGVMGAVIYTRSARPNWATHAHQRAACQCLAAELGYEVSGEFHDNGRTRPATGRHRRSSSRTSTDSADRLPSSPASSRRWTRPTCPSTSSGKAA